MSHDRETFPHALSMYLTRNNTTLIVERDGMQIGQPEIEAKINDFLRDSQWDTVERGKLQPVLDRAERYMDLCGEKDKEIERLKSELRDTKRAIELMCNDFNILEVASSQKLPSTVSEYIEAAIQQSIEGDR